VAWLERHQLLLLGSAVLLLALGFLVRDLTERD